ncbi:hypothetical protein, partial [Roseibium sp. RKSG952]|uniref:hypothetical protein n=1 Tax=Roseibium sp. RKSG952 TaxID=2529384 RepID=UPI001AD91558
PGQPGLRVYAIGFGCFDHGVGDGSSLAAAVLNFFRETNSKIGTNFRDEVSDIFRFVIHEYARVLEWERYKIRKGA